MSKKQNQNNDDFIEKLKIPEDVIEQLKDPMFIKKSFQEGKTFQEIIGYSDDMMEMFYGAAYNLFQRNEFDEATDAFTFLTTLNPFVHNYWLGLGMSEHRNYNYDEALVAYGMASLIDEKNPVPHYHSASCYYEAQDYESALALLELAIVHSKDESYSVINECAISAKSRIEGLEKNV